MDLEALRKQLMETGSVIVPKPEPEKAEAKPEPVKAKVKAPPAPKVDWAEEEDSFEPTGVEQTVVLRFRDGSSDKTWQGFVIQDGPNDFRVVTKYGKTGKTQQERTVLKTARRAEAVQALRKRRAEKVAKGYKAVE
jgi:predicted DNA-binding WGR domain protein